jgi:hypothetical protein
MIVRAGKFLTDDQVTKIEDISSDYYEKFGQMNQLKNCIENIQSYCNSGNYSRAFISIAEGYQTCAITRNKSHPGDKGFTYWDYSWASLQSASDVAVMAANGHPVEDWLWNDYLDSLYGRAQHCLRELKNSSSKKSQSKYAHLSIEMIYHYLEELIRFGRSDDWNRENAIKMVYVSKSLGGLSDKIFLEINTEYLKNAETKGQITLAEEVIDSINDYIFLETDPQKLKWMIY